MTEEYMTIILISVSITGIISLIMSILSSFMRRRDEKFMNQIRMSDMREYYEQKLFELNSKISQNPRLWNEAFHLLDSESEKMFNQNSERVKESKFLGAHGFKTSDYIIDMKSVFVLIPFMESSKQVFTAVQNVTEDEYYLKCSMGDDKYIEGDILPEILKKIAQSRLVIASIDGRNPNVFYELGIAHALDKPTILISHYKNKHDIPIDIKSKYIIIYSDLEDLKNELRKMINKLFFSEHKNITM
ncbi:hypothetical protein RJG79_00660 [Mycoplasmatota bacterium WC44]